jgi:hypothetical protein
MDLGHAVQAFEGALDHEGHRSPGDGLARMAVAIIPAAADADEEVAGLDRTGVIGESSDEGVPTE